MSDNDFSILNPTSKNNVKAEYQRRCQEKIFTNFLEKHRKTHYEIGNFQNSGLSEDLKNELENTTKLKKVGVTWQLFTIDTFAINDFLRAYDCSKTQIAIFALRYYLPSFIYDKATIKCISIVKDTLVEDNITIPDITITTIDEYNNEFNKNLVKFSSKYQDKLESFSWDISKFDLVAIQLFKKLYGFSYNSILQNSIRCFLTEENYTNGEFILRIMQKQDQRRNY